MTACCLSTLRDCRQQKAVPVDIRKTLENIIMSVCNRLNHGKWSFVLYLEHKFAVVSAYEDHLTGQPVAGAPAAHQEPGRQTHLCAARWHSHLTLDLYVILVHEKFHLGEKIAEKNKQSPSCEHCSWWQAKAQTAKKNFQKHNSNKTNGPLKKCQ